MNELVFNLALIAFLIGVDIYIIGRMASEALDLLPSYSPKGDTRYR